MNSKINQLLKSNYRYILTVPALIVLWLAGGINIESTSQEITITKQVEGQIIEQSIDKSTYFYWGWRNKRLKKYIDISPQFIIENLVDESRYQVLGKKKIDLIIMGFEREGTVLIPSTIEIKGNISGLCSSQGAKERVRELIKKIKKGEVPSQENDT